MTKAEADAIVDKLKENNVSRWVYHCANGDLRERNGESSFAIHSDDFLYMVELSRNYSDDKGGEFVLRIIPYDKIDEIDALDISYEDGKQIFTDLNLMNDEIKEFLKTMPRRTILNPNAKAGYEAPIKDEEGKTVVPKGMSGYVVR